MRLSRPVVSLAIALISAVLAVSGLPTAVNAVQVSTSVTWISTPTSPVGIYDPLTFSAKVHETPPDGGTMSLVKNGGGVMSDDLNPNGVASFNKSHYKAKLVSDKRASVGALSGRLLTFNGTDDGRTVRIQHLIIARGKVGYLITMFSDRGAEKADAKLFLRMYNSFKPT